MEKGIESPYALSEIKPYFEDLTLAVIKATAVEMVSEDNFPSKSRKVECATVSVVEIWPAENYSVEKLANLLEKLDKRVAIMESQFDALHLKKINEPPCCCKSLVNKIT